jgi:hypothetical protein
MNVNDTLSKFFRDAQIDFCRDGNTNERLKVKIITFPQNVILSFLPTQLYRSHYPSHSQPKFKARN